MNTLYRAVNGSRPRRRIATWLLALVLLAPLTALATHNPAPRVQPTLLSLAAQHPEQAVSVIIQSTQPTSAIERHVQQLGGRVTQDLHIINAVAARLPARSVLPLAQTTDVRWISLDGTVQQSSTSSVFTTWASTLGTTATTTFNNSDNLIDSSVGANGTFGTGAAVKGSFAGFSAEVTPGYVITKVEVVLPGYAPAKLSAGDDPVLTAVVAGKTGKGVVLNHHAFDDNIGAANAGLAVLDITNSRTWKWADFDNGLELVIDQSKLKHEIAYDAIGLRVTSAPGTSDTSGFKLPTSLPAAAISVEKLQNVYNRVVRAPEVWNLGSKYLQGQGVTVAVIDSGSVKNKDFESRLLGNVNFNESYHDSNDRYGHGTFVADMIASDGTGSGGTRMGIAPKTNLINVRVSDDEGQATTSDVVAALQWVNDNRTKYNIRVVNLSLNATTAQSYDVDPLCAAAEILWFNNVVVVASAGNNGSSTLYAPANDPFVITVGATNDQGTVDMSDDVVATYSAAGTTIDGFAKPDLVAPGSNIVTYLPGNDKLTVGRDHPKNRIDKNYFRMSGTSMAAPIVSGAVALLLQDEPNLTPDQVKYRLQATAQRDRSVWPSYDATRAGAGYLDIAEAIRGTTTATANTGIRMSQILAPDGSTSNTWDSASWGSASWGSASWGSASWGSASWGSDFWGD